MREYDLKYDFRTYIKERAYELKGSYNNVSVLPIPELGEESYVLTLGKQRGSVLILADKWENPIASAMLMLKYFEALARAVKENTSLGEIYPAKIKNSLSIIPFVAEQSESAILDLCEEWEVGRLYNLTSNSNNITCYLSDTNFLQGKLMAELLAADNTRTIKYESENSERLGAMFAEKYKKFAFDIDISAPSTDEELSLWLTKTYALSTEIFTLMYLI